MRLSAAADVRRRWTESGCAALTGRSDGPALEAPPGLVEHLDDVAERLRRASATVGDEVRIDPLDELALRATTHGFHRRGRESCGGATRLLACADGWLAATLARDDDIESVAALVEAEVDDPWVAVAQWCAGRSAVAAQERAVLLGMPFAAVGSGSATDAVVVGEGGRRAAAPGARPLVVDLSSLWAGPLCGALLARAGLDVIKVESAHRLDGAHRGPSAFFDYLNGAKRSLVLDMRSRAGREELLRLVQRADVVIEASRPRALEQLGLHRDQLDGGPAVWVSITAHGRDGANGDRVGFGDDTAAAGGLVMWADGPLFCADAIADPITGVVAAAHAMEALADRFDARRQIDVAMSGVAAACVAAG